MTAALRSTLAALVHEPAAVRRLGLWGIVAALFPVGIGLQAMSLPADAGAPRVSLAQPRTASHPGLSLAAFTKPIADAADQVQLTFSTADFVRAKPFLFAGSLAAREQSVACLAAAAWYEAGNDLESQRSVIQVVLNRVSHPSFPKTICGVVMQGSERSTGCQFTFTCDGSLYRRRPGAASWAAARQLAEAAISGAVDISVSQATHYHADYVTPWWSKKLERLSTVGRHIFYRWYGAQGALSGRASQQEFFASAQSSRLETDANGNLIGRAGPSGQTEAPGSAMTTSLVVYAPSALPRPAMSASPAAAPLVQGGAIVTVVNQASPSGRWALDALGRCGDERGCQVLGYASAENAARNSALSGSQRDRPLFLLIRDRTSGQVLALWDCDAVQRPDAAQCLPQERAQLNALLRDRKAD